MSNISPLEGDMLSPASPTFETDAEATVDATIGSLPSASVSALPNELLAAIFVAGRENLPFSPWVQEIPFEILISHVSHHWRILAHNTPQLWTNVTIDTHDKGHLEWATNYIERSRALLLDVFVYIPDDHGQLPFTLPTICRLLSAEVERLQILGVKSDAAGFPSLDFFFENIPKSVPHLQALDIRLPGPYQDRPHFGVQDLVFPNSMPSLKSLHLAGISLRNNISRHCPITSLQLHQCAYDQSSLRGASHSFPSITQLILSEIYSLHGQWDAGAIEFPSLKALYMRYIDDYDRILSTIVAPELDTLYLESVTDHEMTHVVAVSCFPGSNSPKFPRLRHLMLRLCTGRALPSGLWQAVMEAFQQVLHFTLLDHSDSSISSFLRSFIGKCSARDASRVPWPMLETLSLPHINARLLECVTGVLSKRVEMDCSIRKLQLSPALFSAGDRDSLWGNVGVDVEVVQNPLATLPTACRVDEWVNWNE